MKRVAIVQCGTGNLDSVNRAVEECGGSSFFANDPAELAKASAIILPGVGNFARGMQNLRETGFDVALSERVLDGGLPFLGVCLGMQMLADSGEEGGQTAGLGWIAGRIVKLEATADDERIPHVGWNEVHFASPSRLFDQIDSGRDFYFVHSYHMVCENEDNIIATTPYCGNFVSAVQKQNIFGVQFHPEKSQKAGFALLRNFLSL